MSEDRRIRAGDGVRALLGRLDKGGNMERAEAVAAWREVAGPEVSRHAVGAAMRGSELVVYVDSPVWASELAALSERYRVAVNESVGRELVGSLRFTVSRKAAETRALQDEDEERWSRRADPRVEPVPPTEAERERIAAMAEAIHDERLREAAIRAATADLQWRKGLKVRKSPQGASGGSTGPETDSEH